MDSITQVANKINKGEIKLSDVPEFRRKRVTKFIATVPPDTIALMATKELERDGEVKPKIQQPRFTRTYLLFNHNK